MTQFLDIYAEMAALRAELAYCFLTRKERKETLQRLGELQAEAEQRGEGG